MKLTPRQREVIDRMKEGWELRCMSAVAIYRSRSFTTLEQECHLYLPRSNYDRIAVPLDRQLSLRRKKLIRKKCKYSRGSIYTLTDAGRAA